MMRTPHEPIIANGLHAFPADQRDLGEPFYLDSTAHCFCGDLCLNHPVVGIVIMGFL